MVEQGGPQKLLSLVLRRNPMPTTGEFLAWLGCRRDFLSCRITCTRGSKGSKGCLKVVPIPIPSAIIVIAGMMAKMNEVKILATVYISKFIQLTLGAIALKYATENQTPEQRPGRELSQSALVNFSRGGSANRWETRRRRSDTLGDT